ncbi:hypothetical protein [Rhizobium sp. MHM7A]|uniref:hypothetical protein n=1 Tax=Rhizobium sp. MHM7A TaxID=2583233 RepID=UPI001106A886|nr:hypothetical protein [Rhizobium sp. MHM7A]TLX16061.1 hypothetical protein FFR93_01705 [Rhizobium sp. MHM7A]
MTPDECAMLELFYDRVDGKLDMAEWLRELGKRASASVEVAAGILLDRVASPHGEFVKGCRFQALNSCELPAWLSMLSASDKFPAVTKRMAERAISLSGALRALPSDIAEHDSVFVVRMYFRLLAAPGLQLDGPTDGVVPVALIELVCDELDETLLKDRPGSPEDSWEAVDTAWTDHMDALTSHLAARTQNPVLQHRLYALGNKFVERGAELLRRESDEMGF